MILLHLASVQQLSLLDAPTPHCMYCFHVVQYGETALIKATRSGRKEIVQLLIDKGASMHAANNVGAVWRMRGMVVYARV